jgi:hypothetical protein
VQRAHDPRHVRARGQGLHLLGGQVQAEQPPDLARVGLVAFPIDQVHQRLPGAGAQPGQLAHVLLLLPLRAERDGDHVGRREASDVELDAAGHERAVVGARRLARGEHDELVTQGRHVGEPGPPLVVGPEVFAVRVEDDRAHGHAAAAALVDGRRLAVQVTEQQLHQIRLAEAGPGEDERAAGDEVLDREVDLDLGRAQLHPGLAPEAVALAGVDVLAERQVPDRGARRMVRSQLA